jgi:hypothetical protein
VCERGDMVERDIYRDRKREGDKNDSHVLGRKNGRWSYRVVSVRNGILAGYGSLIRVTKTVPGDVQQDNDGPTSDRCARHSVHASMLAVSSSSSVGRLSDRHRPRHEHMSARRRRRRLRRHGAKVGLSAWSAGCAQMLHGRGRAMSDRAARPPHATAHATTSV